MSLMLQILVRAGSLVALVTMMACGQQGPLYLPQTGGPAAASLPESLMPAKGANSATSTMPLTVPATSPTPPSSATP